MITVTAAQVYSMGEEIAHEVTYSDGTKVRAVESHDKMIRTEHWDAARSVWVPWCKPYVVTHSKARNAERIQQTVRNFLQA